MSLIDTIFFYTRNDYLIINSLLCNRMTQLLNICELVNNDSKGVLQEHQEGKRTLDTESITRYRNRIYSSLNDKVLERIKSTAKSDITNILDAMILSKDTALFYRTIWKDRIVDTFNENKVNDIITFNNISSTSLTPYRENDGKEFYRYEFIVPKNFKILELNQFGSFVRNEDNEVLLPPMKCRIVSISKSSNIYCNGIIRFECLEQVSPKLNW